MLVVCPKCGTRGEITIWTVRSSGKPYRCIYVKHRSRGCYLGPADHRAPWLRSIRTIESMIGKLAIELMHSNPDELHIAKHKIKDVVESLNNLIKYIESLPQRGGDSGS